MRDLQKEQTLGLLVKSASHLFRRKGYSNTMVEEIAARAGTSRATFYLHFQRKWQVVFHIAQDSINPETIDFYRRLDSFGLPTDDQLRGWLYDAVDFYERHAAFLVVYRQAILIEPDLAKKQIELLRECVEVMPNYLARWGEERKEEAKLRLNMLTFQISDVVMRFIRNEIKVERELLVEVMLEYWRVGLRDPNLKQSHPS